MASRWSSSAGYSGRDRGTTDHGGHSGVQEIHLIPAVPAPAAVAMGLDRMPKAHPRLVVDDKRGEAGFEKTCRCPTAPPALRTGARRLERGAPDPEPATAPSSGFMESTTACR